MKCTTITEVRNRLKHNNHAILEISQYNLSLKVNKNNFQKVRKYVENLLGAQK